MLPLMLQCTQTNTYVQISNTTEQPDTSSQRAFTSSLPLRVIHLCLCWYDITNTLSSEQVCLRGCHPFPW